MNRMKLVLPAAAVIVALFMNACKHKEEDSFQCVAGTGGSNSFLVYAIHGDTPLPNYFTHPDTAFVKFGTTVSPGVHPSDYDTFYVSEPGEDHIHCTGLKCGDYFIYRTAWDSVENITRYGSYGISVADTSGLKEIHVAVN